MTPDTLFTQHAASRTATLDREPDVPGTLALVFPEAGRPLTFDRTVARSLVHRACVAEVFLTDAVRDGADDFRLAAQWPRTHGFYRRDAAGRQDPLLVVVAVSPSGVRPLG